MDWNKYPQSTPTDYKEYLVTMYFGDKEYSVEMLKYVPSKDTTRINHWLKMCDLYDPVWIPEELIVAFAELPEPFKQ